MTFAPKFLTTGIGSVPMENSQEAVNFIREYLPEAPHWPQLLAKSFEESSFEGQYLAPLLKFGLASKVGEKVIFNWKDDDFETRLTEFYTVALEAMEGNEAALEHFAFPRNFAAGFYAFLDSMTKNSGQAKYIKGQLSGPLTVGLQLVDQDRRAIYYHPQLKDVLIKTLALHGLWQAKALGQTGLPVILFVDDPSLSSYGLSAYITLNRDEIKAELDEIYAGARQTGAILGTHVCASTDWTVLMDTSVDILNFDAYEFFSSLAVYPDQLKAFLARGSSVAWGLVPTSAKILDETVDSLTERFQGYLEQLTAKGLDRATLLKQAMLTPSCGTGTLSPELSQRVHTILAQLGPRLARLL